MDNESRPSLFESLTSPIFQNLDMYKKLSKMCNNPINIFLWKMGVRPIVFHFKDGSSVALHDDKAYAAFWESLQASQASAWKLHPQIKPNHIIVRKKNNALGRLVFFYDSKRSLSTTLAMIQEQFVEDQYSKLNVHGKVVLDIGANIGDSAIYFALKGAREVIAYEPYPYSYRLAVKNVMLNGLCGGVTVVNAAVSGERHSDFTTIDPTFKSHPGSRLEQFRKGIRIKNYSLKELVERHRLKDAVLKVDVEGDEYEIFRDLSAATLRAFTEIILEYHASARPLERKLRSAGFSVYNDHVGLLYAKRKD